MFLRSRTLVQQWRSTGFSPDAPDSRIEVMLKPVEGGTELTLTHSNLPEDGMHYRQGWVEHYFEPMTAYFSGN